MNRSGKSNGQTNNQVSLPSGYQIINETESIMHGTGDYGGLKRSSEDAGLDNCTDSDNDALSPAHPGIGVYVNTLDGNPKPGKKTRGRVKIDMKYIENKLRRYTTFSKRKTGIMKKAYELSTLTGTQVMLLVASETGHVYTFATRKLQPMITSDTGKALIQTCLNSPDLGQSSPGGALPGDQRMNPTGFEETEITYTQDDDGSSRDMASGIPILSVANIKQEPFSTKPVPPTPGYIINSSIETNGDAVGSTPSSSPHSVANQSSHTYAPVQSANSVNTGMAVQMPPPGFMIQTGGTSLPPISMSPFDNPSSRHDGTVVSNNTLQQYRAPEQTPTLVQVSSGSQNLQQQGALANNTQSELLPQVQTNTIPTPQGIALMQGGVNQVVNTSQPALVYQTPGMVYATPQQVSQSLSSLPEGFVLGLQQAQALGLQQASLSQSIDATQLGTGTPQYITIPVPVTLANAAQTQVFSIPVAQSAQPLPGMKKS